MEKRRLAGKVGEIEKERIRPVKNSQLEVDVRLDQLGWIWKRIWADSPATEYTYR